MCGRGSVSALLATGTICGLTTQYVVVVNTVAGSTQNMPSYQLRSIQRSQEWNLWFPGVVTSCSACTLTEEPCVITNHSVNWLSSHVQSPISVCTDQIAMCGCHWPNSHINVWSPMTVRAQLTIVCGHVVYLGNTFALTNHGVHWPISHAWLVDTNSTQLFYQCTLWSVNADGCSALAHK